MKSLSPEERAEKRTNVLLAEVYAGLPKPVNEPTAEKVHQRTKDWSSGAATIFREQVEPLEAEVSRLRALVQELTNRLHKERLKYSDIVDMLNIDHGLLSAKEQGFVPTNTEDK